eukprot:982953-Prymnesium_polylepis.1
MATFCETSWRASGSLPSRRHATASRPYISMLARSFLPCVVSLACRNSTSSRRSRLRPSVAKRE